MKPFDMGLEKVGRIDMFFLPPTSKEFGIGEGALGAHMSAGYLPIEVPNESTVVVA